MMKTDETFDKTLYMTTLADIAQYLLMVPAPGDISRVRILLANGMTLQLDRDVTQGLYDTVLIFEVMK